MVGVHHHLEAARRVYPLTIHRLPDRVYVGSACLGHGLGQLTSFTTSIGAQVAGALSGALGGMLMSKYAANVLQSVGSYTPIFVFASVAYLLALLVVHLIVPRYTPVTGLMPEN